MNQSPNPVQMNGNRNLFCPHYRSCLDHAARHHWQSWACLSCNHKLITEAGMEGPLTTGEYITYYNLASEVCFKLE